jgi:hypothetical protein
MKTLDYYISESQRGVSSEHLLAELQQETLEHRRICKAFGGVLGRTLDARAANALTHASSEREH